MAAHWEKIDGEAMDIGVGADGSVWALSTEDVPASGYQILKWDAQSKKWDRGPGGQGTSITVGPDGTPWVVNRLKEIWHHGAGGWHKVDGSANDIGVGADGSIWVIGTEPRPPGGYDILNWDEQNKSWVRDRPGQAARISVGPDGTAWVVNSVSTIWRRVAKDRWVQLPGYAQDIGVGADGTVWVIGSDGKGRGYRVSKWNAQASNWSTVDVVALGIADGVDKAEVRIAVDRTGTPWVVNSKGEIFHLLTDQ